MNSRMTRLRRRDFFRMAIAGGVALAVPLIGSRNGSPAAQPGEELQLHRRSFDAIGTTITIRVEDDIPSGDIDADVTSASDEIRRLEMLLTRFEGGTELCQLNRTSSLESPSADVVAVLKAAESFSTVTGGSFDITVKPVIDLLEGYLRGQPFPSDSQFESARSLINYEDVSVSSKLVGLKKGMSATVDGIAEGYILDRTVSVLKSRGIRSALIDVGGTIAAIGSRADGGPWQVGIVDPLEPDRTIGTLRLSNQAVTTSGDYENYFTPDKHYYHIIDPSTARSPLCSHSATVVAPMAMEADPMGVALMVEEPESGMRLVDAGKCECLLYTRSKEMLTSAGMKELMS